jgi:hypothetical protein
LYEGFNISFFIYTLFWPLSLFIAVKLYPGKVSKIFKINKYETIIKLYMILSMPYLILGFGPFSNRYAMLCWLFVPFMQVVFVSIFFRNINFFIPILFILALVHFLFIYLDWLYLFN